MTHKNLYIDFILFIVLGFGNFLRSKENNLSKSLNQIHDVFRMDQFLSGWFMFLFTIFDLSTGYI